MAIRKIITKDDDTLYKISKPVTVFDDKLHTLLDDMRDTLRENKGAGLAAVQVGILRRIFIIEMDGKIYEFINPEILKEKGSQQTEEGCLSFPGVFGITKRPGFVTVKAQDRYGNYFTLSGKDFFAKAISHENDHLNGNVFIDKVVEFTHQNDDFLTE